MDKSEFEVEFDLGAFYQFMLRSEKFRKTLSRSEKVRILREQGKSTSNLAINSQLESECVEVEIENS